MHAPEFESQAWPEDRLTLYGCPQSGCDGYMVSPIDWEKAGGDTSWVLLRCGECETFFEGVLTDKHVDQFDEEFELEAMAMEKELKDLSSKNMGEALIEFSHALDLDLVLPEDF